VSKGATIDVVLALPGRCRRVEVSVADGMTAAEAAKASGLIDICEQYAGERPVLGIYGRKVEPGHMLRPGDRLELYRPLTADPRARRRARAAQRD